MCDVHRMLVVKKHRLNVTLTYNKHFFIERNAYCRFRTVVSSYGRIVEKKYKKVERILNFPVAYTQLLLLLKPHLTE